MIRTFVFIRTCNFRFGHPILIRASTLYRKFLMIRTTGRSDPIRTIGQALLTGRRKANRILGFDSDNSEHQATPAISTGKCCQNEIKSQNQKFGLNNRTSGKSGHRQHRLMCVRVIYRTTGHQVVRITIRHPVFWSSTMVSSHKNWKISHRAFSIPFSRKA